ncbi:MAG: hypothetical protein HOP08_01115 [Cyclobacteriaceae bacterium]|nr:hypothetical protein [Cyclobacteriaceae bacterium]
MKMTLSIIAVATMVVVVIGYNLYNKKHRSLFENTALIVTAQELFTQYVKDEQGSNQKYLDKIVEVTGTVGMLFENKDSKPVIVLKGKDDFFGVSCTLEHFENVQMGSTITIRGFCMGYLSDVVISRAEIIKK